MARILRTKYVEALYHAVARGNERKAILRRFRQAAIKRVHGWAVGRPNK